ncbi:MAG: crotonase [Deltaproteobacteria bacterium]|nr:crotonase [Deltaproteobacteria bacterium]
MSKALIIESTRDHVTTVTMDNPARLNGWTAPMLEALLATLKRLRTAPETRAIILTGSGKYYSAGVNLGGTLRIAHPKVLHSFIVEHNQAIFDAFLDLDKPIIAAVNGPTIGAPTTSATLCDAIIASEEATFSTPFARLGVTPEGCSSVYFAQLMGAENAERMLGPEGWRPTAQEALNAGLIDRVVPRENLLMAAHAMAVERIASGRRFRADATREALKAINARESVQLAGAFLSPPFIKGQMKFLWSKKKHGPATMFAGLWITSPLWRLLL